MAACTGHNVQKESRIMASWVVVSSIVVFSRVWRVVFQEGFPIFWKLAAWVCNSHKLLCDLLICRQQETRNQSIMKLNASSVLQRRSCHSIIFFSFLWWRLCYFRELPFYFSAPSPHTSLYTSCETPRDGQEFGFVSVAWGTPVAQW